MDVLIDQFQLTKLGPEPCAAKPEFMRAIETPMNWNDERRRRREYHRRDLKAIAGRRANLP
jgi:hypothetical protein